MTLFGVSSFAYPARTVFEPISIKHIEVISIKHIEVISIKHIENQSLGRCDQKRYTIKMEDLTQMISPR